MFISFLFVNHFRESSFKDEPYRQPRPYGLKGDAANENSTRSWIGAHPEVVGNGRRRRPLQVSKGQCGQRNSPFSLPGVGARAAGATGNLRMHGCGLAARRGSINEAENKHRSDKRPQSGGDRPIAGLRIVPRTVRCATPYFISLPDRYSFTSSILVGVSSILPSTSLTVPVAFTFLVSLQILSWNFLLTSLCAR